MNLLKICYISSSFISSSSKSRSNGELYVLYGDCHTVTDALIFGQIMRISMTVVNTYILHYREGSMDSD